MCDPSQRESKQRSNAELSKVFRSLFTELFPTSRQHLEVIRCAVTSHRFPQATCRRRAPGSSFVQRPRAASHLRSDESPLESADRIGASKWSHRSRKTCAVDLLLLRRICAAADVREPIT